MLQKRISFLFFAVIVLILASGCSQLLDALGMKGSDGADGISVTWRGDLPSAPANPEINWAYYDTTQMKAFVYDGSAWAILAVSGVDGADGADAPDIQIQYSSDTSSWHVSYASGDAYLRTSIDGGATWSPAALFRGDDGADGANAPNLQVQYSSDSTNWHGASASGDAYLRTSADGGVSWGPAILFKGADGVDGNDGVSIVWKGSLAAAPDPASLSWAYYNTADKKSYVYDGSSWQTLAQDGSDGQTVYVGEFGSDVYLQYEGQAIIENGGVQDLATIVVNSGSSTSTFDFSLTNNSAMSLTLVGIDAIGARCGSDTSDSVSEITVDAASASTVKFGSPLSFSILGNYVSFRSGASFRKRFRIKLESDAGDLYNFEFEVSGTLTSG